jgi:UDP-N-acetylglucosamine 1-carboxyvinyltransferase
MGRILIKGGIPLRGRVKISGAKNASLALLCAAILARNEIVLENVPDISDVRVMIEIITALAPAPPGKTLKPSGSFPLKS